MLAAIIEVADDLGIRHGGCWRDGWVKNMCWHHEIISFGSLPVGESSVCKKAHTPEAFIAKMRVTAKKPKPITISNQTVEFTANGDIKFGLIGVDFAKLEAIYNEAKKHRP